MGIFRRLGLLAAGGLIVASGVLYAQQQVSRSSEQRSYDENVENRFDLLGYSNGDPDDMIQYSLISESSMSIDRSLTIFAVTNRSTELKNGSAYDSRNAGPGSPYVKKERDFSTYPLSTTSQNEDFDGDTPTWVTGGEYRGVVIKTGKAQNILLWELPIKLYADDELRVYSKVTSGGKDFIFNDTVAIDVIEKRDLNSSEINRVDAVSSGVQHFVQGTGRWKDSVVYYDGKSFYYYNPSNGEHAPLYTTRSPKLLSLSSDGTGLYEENGNLCTFDIRFLIQNPNSSISIITDPRNPIDVRYARLSPEGDMLAFLDSSDVYLVDRTTNLGLRDVVKRGKVSEGAHVDDQWDPWSPDGDKIAIPLATGIRVYDRVSRTSIDLEVPGFPKSVRWSPQGRKVGCIVEDRLLVSAVDGSGTNVVGEGVEKYIWTDRYGEMVYTREGKAFFADAATGESIDITEGFDGSVESMAYIKNRGLVIFVSDGKLYSAKLNFNQ